MEEINVYTDGGSRNNPGKSGIGILITDGNNNELIRYKEYIGEATNNEAEYRALIKSISLIKKIIGKKPEIKTRIKFHSDSELMVNQLNGKYSIKSSNLISLAKKFQRDIKKLDNNFKITHISRDKNKIADKLANQAIDEELRRSVLL